MGHLVYYSIIIAIAAIFVSTWFSKTVSSSSLAEPLRIGLSLLLGALLKPLLDSASECWDRPVLSLECSEGDSPFVRRFENSDVDYLVRVRNSGRSVARNCQIKISVLELTPDLLDPISTEENTYIQRTTFFPIQEENIPWALRREGQNPLFLDIPAKASFVVHTASRHSDILKIPSEEAFSKSRAFLQLPRDYRIELTVFGENCGLVSKVLTIRHNAQSSG